MRSKHHTVWRDLFALAIIFLMATLVGAASMTALKLPLIAVYSVQFALAIAAASFYYLRGVERPAAEKPLLRFSFKWYNASLTIWGLVMLTATGIVLEPLMGIFPESWFDRLNETVGSGGATVLLLVVIAPVCEEIFFRGLVLEQTRRGWSAFWAVVASSLFFGIVHMPVWPQVVNAFVVGIVLGYIYVSSGSLVPVIIIHAVNNAIAYLMLEITGAQSTGFREMIANDAIFWTVYAAAAVVCTVSLTRMITASRKADDRGALRSNKTNETALKKNA